MMNSIVYPHIVRTALAAAAVLAAQAQSDPDFIPLFNGQNLDGWRAVSEGGPPYQVTGGLLICPQGTTTDLFTERIFTNFVLRFDFRLSEGANNGIGIRAPLSGAPSYLGMEIQILDNRASRHAGLSANQYHGSIFDVAPARRGFLKPAGEWNSQEIRAIGREIQVSLNDQLILSTNLNRVTDLLTLAKHPGILRAAGHIGILGRGDLVAFRNIRIRDLPDSPQDNTPPPGFSTLFNGRNLDGWKGLVADPPKRARMSPNELVAAQEAADNRMRSSWSVADGVLRFDGKGDNLCSARDYGDFEMLVDWKIGAKGDSGVYLRGSPQVQIWDAHARKIGSGGLFNNKLHPSEPLKFADNPIGEWNRFRILLIGDKVTVFLNGELVVHNVTMENYWEREKPLYPIGPVELQNHGDPLYFKNIYIRELPR